VFLLDRDAARNQATAVAIELESGFAQAVTADVCDAAAIAAAVDAAMTQFGRIGRIGE